MTRPVCSRLWQVAAIRDGRLSGKDLELAQRHREHCSECAEETRKLAELTQGMVSLPELPRDALSVRRSRQRLMAAVNESLLTSPRKRERRWLPALALLPAAALTYTVVVWHAVPTARPELPQSAVEVRAKAGSHWLRQISAASERIELSDGEASFEVHPHADRRVLIRVPDGELEDLGTTFEVTVRDAHTSHIAVSKGRVAVRLSSRPEFTLSAGEHWELPLTESAPPTASAGRPTPSAATPPLTGAPRSSPPPPRAASKAQSSAAVAPALPSATLESDSTRAEDTAYLSVISLLRKGRDAEARTQAKAYLLRFPSGFRRVEMLNVATSSGNSSALP